jgi:hypothetical protein
MQENTPLGHIQSGSLVGSIFYQKCPDDPRYYRSIRIANNPFNGGIKPQISNPIFAEPPPELKQISPHLLTRLLRHSMSSQFC